MIVRHRQTTGSFVTPAPGLRAGVLAAFAVFAGFVAPPLFAGDTPAGPPLHDPRDIRITLKARQSLAMDGDLGRYPICVTVRQGNATLWGQVPEALLAERAVSIVSRVPGVFRARSDLTIGPVEPARDEAPRLPGHSAVPVIVEPPERRDPRARGVLAGNSREAPPSLADAARMGRPTPIKPAANETPPPAMLLPPRPLDRTESIRSAIQRLIQSDVRFAGIQCHERAGVVTLSGDVARMEHVVDLARQAARVAGVSEVVVENVHLTPR
jgi:osmotically-inducible protein OsmY